MGSEADPFSGCMFERGCTRTVPHFERSRTFYNGRLRQSNKGETLINMGYEADLLTGCMFDRGCTRTVPTEKTSALGYCCALEFCCVTTGDKIFKTGGVDRVIKGNLSEHGVRANRTSLMLVNTIFSV